MYQTIDSEARQKQESVYKSRMSDIDDANIVSPQGVTRYHHWLAAAFLCTLLYSIRKSSCPTQETHGVRAAQK